MTKLEEVARAISEAIPFGVDQADAAKAARAAIEALREPSEAMLAAGAVAPGDGNLEAQAWNLWEAMIDAILSEGET